MGARREFFFFKDNEKNKEKKSFFLQSFWFQEQLNIKFNAKYVDVLEYRLDWFEIYRVQHEIWRQIRCCVGVILFSMKFDAKYAAVSE